MELGWAALQARHLSNVGYGIDNRIGLNGELRDTLEFLRNVFESELFVKSMLKYDHFWPNLINRKQYSPKPNELEKQHDELYAQSLYFDIVFYPSWDTVAMDVDAAREAGKIGYKCTIAVNGLGQFEADLDGDEMSRILNGLITGKEYTKIKQQAGPDVNESMMTGLGWLAEKFDYRPFDDPTNIKRVDFYAPVSQNYGYDAYENAILSGNYDNVSIKGKQYHVPWKSVAVQKPESVVAIVRLKEKDKPAGAKLKFITTTGQEAKQVTRADDTTYHVVLPPVTSEGEFGLLATYSYKNEEDKEITVNAGQANITGYTTNPQKVVIVPVNGNKAGLTATGLKKALDEIYKQAATTWNVEIYNGNLQVKSVYADDGKLDDGETGFLSNYTEEMNEVIETFKDRPGVDIDKNTCYLFLVDKAKSGPGKCGFMPLKRPFGFIFTDSRCSNNISHTIAHELGHGPFRLYHTFSSENEYKQGKGTTDNLMDYMTSTEKLGENKALYKYQWDLIHDPEAMIALFQDEEEGEASYRICKAYFKDPDWNYETKTLLINGKSYEVPYYKNFDGFTTSNETNQWVAKNGKTYESAWEMPEENTNSSICNPKYYLAIDYNAYKEQEPFDENGNSKKFIFYEEMNSPYSIWNYHANDKSDCRKDLTTGVSTCESFDISHPNLSGYENLFLQWMKKKWKSNLSSDLHYPKQVQALAKALMKGGELNYEDNFGVNQNALYEISYHVDNGVYFDKYYSHEEIQFWLFGYIANKHLYNGGFLRTAAIATQFLNEDELILYPLNPNLTECPWNIQALGDGWRFSINNGNAESKTLPVIKMYEPFIVDNSYLIEGFGIGDAVEVALWVYTGGTTGALKKITVKVGSKMLLAAYVDWQIQIFISMLEGYSFEEATIKVDYTGALWVGLTSAIESHTLSGALNCVKASINEIEKKHEFSWGTVSYTCLFQLLKSELVQNIVSAPNSPYQTLISKVLKGKSESEILFILEEIGLTKKEAAEMLSKGILNHIIVNKSQNNDKK